MIDIIYRMMDQIIIIKRNFRYRRFNFKNIILGDVAILGNDVEIGVGTYINSGRIYSSPNGKVKIGRWCAIGFNVNFLAVSHDSFFPTGNIKTLKEKDITIGDGVWIGSNVVILPGVTIGDYSIIGANSVVNTDIPDFNVFGGCPARLLYIKDKEKCKEHINFIGRYKTR